MRHIWLLFLAALASSLSQRAGAETYPARPIMLIVVQGPGSALDVVARALSSKFETLGFPMVVVNREGAFGEIGVQACARAAADGYTLCIVPDGPAATIPAARAAAGEPRAPSLAAIGIIGDQHFGLAVRKSLPDNLPEFIADAKAHPNALACGSANIWGTLGIAMLNSLGLTVREIPYTGEPQMYLDLKAGRIDCAFSTLTVARPYVQSGDVRVLGTVGPGKDEFSPGVESLAEEGYPQFAQFWPWIGLFGPTGMPGSVVSSLNRSLRATLKDPDFIAVLGHNLISVHPAEVPPQAQESVDKRLEDMKKFLCIQHVTIMGYACKP